MNLPCCRYCLSDTHFSHECLYVPAETSAPIHKDPRGAANSGGFRHPQPPESSADAVELRGLFNRTGGSNQCHYRYCRYAHICSKCHTGPHPEAECGKHSTSRSPRTSAGSLSLRRGTRQPPPPQQWLPLVARCTYLSCGRLYQVSTVAVMFWVDAGLKPGTIKVYLAVVRNLHWAS